MSRSSQASEPLRKVLHSGASRGEKAIALLAHLDAPATITDLKRLAAANGLKVPSSWNLSTTLTRTKGAAISTPKGWELTDTGRSAAENLGISRRTPAVVQTLMSLRSEVTQLSSADTQRFLGEAVECLEQGHYRAAVIMSWVAAVHMLQTEVISHKLKEFNSEATRRDAKWRDGKTIDDLSRMKESDLLEVLVAIGLIGKNVKTELKNCLDRRNACGHPNSYELKELTAAHHVETLVANVFAKF